MVARSLLLATLLCALACSGGGSDDAEPGATGGSSGSTLEGGTGGGVSTSGSSAGGKASGGADSGGDTGAGGETTAGTGGSSAGGPALKDPSEVEVEVTVIPALEGCEQTPYPHDPAVDELTGLVYFTDSNASCIGEFDPETMQFRGWPTPTADSYPHGLDVSGESLVFYTGQDQDLIGRLDPVSGMIDEFPVTASGPHTPLLHMGSLWFTNQPDGSFGRMDPETGTHDIYALSSGDTRPYGVWPAPDGSIWVALFGTNRVARIDTNAEPPTAEEFVLPNEDARPRRIAVDAAGRAWYTDYERRALGLVDPTGAEVDYQEYPTPGLGRPYGIAIGPDGRVWYDDQDAPEIVCFDPEARVVLAQAPVPIDNSGPVRNMDVDLVRKRIWLAISNVGQLGLMQF